MIYFVLYYIIGFMGIIYLQLKEGEVTLKGAFLSFCFSFIWPICLIVVTIGYIIDKGDTVILWKANKK